MLNITGDDNVINHPDNVVLVGSISGNCNRITILSAFRDSKINIHINGNYNDIYIGNVISINDMRIRCGNHISANGTQLSIGNGFSVEPNSEILLYNHNCKASIGDDCLFSKDIVIRCGEAPHLIFDENTGEYLDQGGAVAIGSHVWIGERVYITKKAKIPNNVVVGACSVVTRAFERENCVIVGNPARIAKENVRWVRNRDFIPRGSIYEAGYKAYLDEASQRENSTRRSHNP
jgi:acetyltransferase-like isoleucine patch superfamily enzyme